MQRPALGHRIRIRTFCRGLRIRPAILVVTWAFSLAAVTYYSLIPDLRWPFWFPQMDKVGHFAAYAWLSFLPVIGLADRRPALGLSASLIAFGILLEFAQAHVPGRVFSLGDAAANCGGIFTGLICAYPLKARPRLKRIPLDILLIAENKFARGPAAYPGRPAILPVAPGPSASPNPDGRL